MGGDFKGGEGTSWYVLVCICSSVHWRITVNITTSARRKNRAIHPVKCAFWHFLLNQFDGVFNIFLRNLCRKFSFFGIKNILWF